MASSAAHAPSKTFGARQIAARAPAAIERWLERERDQLALWIPVMLGAGAAAWFVLPDPRAWSAALLTATGVAAIATAIGRGGRAGAALAIAAVLVAAGLALTWWRAERVAAPVLTRATIATVGGTVARVEALPARGLVRVTLDDVRWDPVPDPAPVRVRVNLDEAAVPHGLGVGARIAVRARMMPPAPPAVPGAYDFARVAWFDRLGATGRGFVAVTVAAPARDGDGIRATLTAHILRRLPGSEGGIAAALATGDTGAISDDDAEAMRRAGLAHLLSVSGLHITAAVGIVMALVMRLLALWPRLALTGRVPLFAGAAGAAAAIGYTWLTGAQVPTIRSCVAALMVLAALALGREAVTLRLVAVGALVVLLAWPEAVVSPSFQLSFAAVTAIVALHEIPHVRGWFAPRDEAWVAQWGRGLASLLLTGLVVEAALMPIAAFHFHKAGAYGAAANIVAIPLTTFVVMPAEAIALALDAVGLGAPAWWVAHLGLALLLWIARTVAAAPGAVAAIPGMPAGAFGLMAAGGLWVALWRTRWRLAGLIPVAIGAGWALATPPPDLIVTGDGRHLAWRGEDGTVAILRDRAGDYVRDTLAEGAGLDDEPALLSQTPGARCNRDLCWLERGTWRVLATRSAYFVPVAALVPLCRQADIVVSDRRLPRGCRARWVTLDRATLARTGGVAVTLAQRKAVSVRRSGDAHPWVRSSDRGGEKRVARGKRGLFGAEKRGRDRDDGRTGTSRDR
ncbi:ComEC/Rec2 family competence protein [uncultured Sphingomonas sp.]|uniref:ComEC/Rec2 family competence protein n=1 Tax=uncultured Sphingomonas sp. TaxID=158754 RepID=UPI0030DBF122